MRFSKRFNTTLGRWAMIRAPDLRRSLLFVAGADGAAHTQALQSRPDVLVQDLEDFTPQQSKHVAREMSADLFARARAGGIIPAVRVNVLSGLGMIDLEVVVPAKPELILLPKAESAQQIVVLAQEIERIEATQGLSVGKIEIVPTARPRKLARRDLDRNPTRSSWLAVAARRRDDAFFWCTECGIVVAEYSSIPWRGASAPALPCPEPPTPPT